MGESSTGKYDAATLTMPTVDFEQTTTLPSDAKPFFASTGSVKEQSVFTGMVSTSFKNRYRFEEKLEELKPICSDSSVLLIVEALEDGTYHVKHSMMILPGNLSTGYFPEDQEPCEQ